MTTRRTPIRVPDLRIETSEMPEPGLLRPAIDAALAARPFPAGPESEVAHTVADAVTHAVTHAVTGAVGSTPPKGGTSC